MAPLKMMSALQRSSKMSLLLSGVRRVLITVLLTTLQSAVFRLTLI
jgi:hypothetical protein